MSGDRIDFYDRRVAETVARLELDFGCAHIDDSRWAVVKRHYIGLLIDHKQPECAETFFNSVSCKILHRTYFHNRCLFVRPAVSTEHIDADPPSYRSYYPREHGLRQALIDIVLDFGSNALRGFPRRSRQHPGCVSAAFPRPLRLEANHQIQVLRASSSAIGPPTSSVASSTAISRSLSSPIKHDADGISMSMRCSGRRAARPAFSANRAYFLVDMEVPSAYVTFLRHIAPERSEAELYTMVGLQSRARRFSSGISHHLKRSTDDFVLAPGIKGLVMTVFTLPSYPYVFKVIKDRIAPSKDTTATGSRRSTSWSSTMIVSGGWPTRWNIRCCLPRALLCRADRGTGSGRTDDHRKRWRDDRGQASLHRRRMTLLNLYLARATPAQREHAMGITAMQPSSSPRSTFSRATCVQEFR